MLKNSAKGFAIVLLILGLPTMGFLTFAVAMSFLFYIFASPPLGRQILGYLSLVGPLPLCLGAILLLFSKTEKLGSRLAFAGSFILSVYLVICYSRVQLGAIELLERILWFGVVPVAVLTVDYTAYRAYLEIKGKREIQNRAVAS